MKHKMTSLLEENNANKKNKERSDVHFDSSRIKK